MALNQVGDPPVSRIDPEVKITTPSPARRGSTSGPYGGYFSRDAQTRPADDLEILQTGPNTPMGEYMRRYWQPVCLSQQLTDVPKAIKILHEDLVAFRDRAG